MSDTNDGGLSRCDLIKATGTVAAGSALAGLVLPQVHAGGGDAIKIALIGCGGRGTGAIDNALSVRSGQTQLVAMADVFQNRLNSSYEATNRGEHRRQVDVPPE